MSPSSGRIIAVFSKQGGPDAAGEAGSSQSLLDAYIYHLSITGIFMYSVC